MLDALNRLAHQAAGAQVIETLRKRAPTWLVQMPGVIDDGAFVELQSKVVGREPAADAARDGRRARATEYPAAAGAGVRGSALERSFDDHVDRPDRAADGARAPDDSRNASAGRDSARRASAANAGARIGGTLLRRLDAARRSRREKWPSTWEIESSRPRLATRCRSNEVARSIHQRTEGNPLYMVTLVGALIGNDGASASNGVGEARVVAGSDRRSPSESCPAT